jgi:hypothetical protein
MSQERTPPAAGPTALVAPMRRILRVGGIASAIALPAAALLGFLVGGAPGAWGALIGMGLAVSFFAVTIAVALVTARMDPTRLGIWVLGSWLVKMVLLLVVLALLRDADFYSRPALFIALLIGTAGGLLLEARIVTTTRVPYVEPGQR